METRHPEFSDGGFTREQLAELRSSIDRAVSERSPPLLPAWYRDLQVPDRGLAVVLAKAVAP